MENILVDIHTHLLVGIDDGSQEMSDSLKTIKIFHSQGYELVVCTPHISSFYNNSEFIIRKAYRSIDVALRREKINIKLFYGAEYSFYSLYEKLITEESLIFLNHGKDTGRNYVLVELPMEIKPPWYDNLFERLSDKNIGIVIAHPERHSNIKPFEKIWSDNNSILALNMSSLLGEEGKLIKSNAFYLLSKYGKNVVICSDAHPALKRYPETDILVQQLQKNYPPLVINYWLRELPRSILLGSRTSNVQSKVIESYLSSSVS